MKNTVHTLKLAYRLAVIFLLTSHDNLYATQRLVQQHCLTVLNYKKSKKVAEEADFLGNLKLLIQSTDEVSKGKRGSVYTQLGFDPNNKDIDFILSLRWAYVKGCAQAGSSQSVKEPVEAQGHLLGVLTYASKKQKEALSALKDKLGSKLLQVIQEDEINTSKAGLFFKELGYIPSKTKDIPFLYSLQWAYQEGVHPSLHQHDTAQASSDEQPDLYKGISYRPQSESVNDMRRSPNGKNRAHSRASKENRHPSKPLYGTYGRYNKRAKRLSESSDEEVAKSSSQGGDWLPLFLVIGSVLAISAKISHSLYHTHMSNQKPVGIFKIQKKLQTE